MSKWKRVGGQTVSGPEYDDNFRLVKAVLDGATFESVANVLGISRQAAHKRFKETVVNPPFTVISHGSCNDIGLLRKRWQSLKAE